MEIRKLENGDKDIFISLVKQFYETDSVAFSIPEKNMYDAFAELLSGSPYADAFLIIENGNPVGYMLLAYTYSMEYGGKIAIIDELFISPGYQGKGIGSAAIRYIKELFTGELKALRLDVVPEKKQLRRLYEKHGFKMMKYASMICETAASEL